MLSDKMLELCCAIEAIPAGLQQTKVSVMASELHKEIKEQDEESAAEECPELRPKLRPSTYYGNCPECNLEIEIVPGPMRTQVFKTNQN